MNVVAADKAAEIRQLFEEHQRAMRRIAYQIVQDSDVAKDVVQDVFIKLWEKWDDIERGAALKYYLNKAVMHTAINYLNSRKKMVNMSEETERSLKDSSAPTAAEPDSSLKKALMQAIESLPPKCRTIFILCKQEGLRYKEIAEYLEISEKTVENQMGIALRKLREQLPGRHSN